MEISSHTGVSQILYFKAHFWMDGWRDGWMVGWMHGWMDGRTDGQTDGRTDGQTDKQSDRQARARAHTHTPEFVHFQQNKLPGHFQDNSRTRFQIFLDIFFL